MIDKTLFAVDFQSSIETKIFSPIKFVQLNSTYYSRRKFDLFNVSLVETETDYNREWVYRQFRYR